MGSALKTRPFANYSPDRWCTLSGSVKLLMIPVAVLVVALHLWTPKTGKGVAIYSAIVLAMPIVYFALRGLQSKLQKRLRDRFKTLAAELWRRTTTRGRFQP
jgi:hypothetical protein